MRMSNKIILCTNLIYMAKPIIDLLIDNSYDVIVFDKKPDYSTFISIKPMYIISYSYSYIFRKDIVDYFRGRIFNIHLSFLPYNKGYRPTIWNLICDFPIGVTIHKIDYGIDTGPILVQEIVRINKYKDTLRTSWLKHHFVAQKLFMLNWKKIFEGQIKEKKQVGKGNYNSIEKFNKFIRPIIDSLGWDIKIIKFIKIIQRKYNVKELCKYV